MFRKQKPRVEITHSEHKVLKALDENMKRQAKNRTEFLVTAAELLEDYCKIFPPSFLQKVKKEPSISVELLETLLISLSEKRLAVKDLRNYSDRALKQETRFFKLSEEGRVHLHGKK